MLPPGMDPKKMQALMRQMGIKSENIAAKKSNHKNGFSRFGY